MVDGGVAMCQGTCEQSMLRSTEVVSRLAEMPAMCQGTCEQSMLLSTGVDGLSGAKRCARHALESGRCVSARAAVWGLLKPG